MICPGKTMYSQDFTAACGSTSHHPKHYFTTTYESALFSLSSILNTIDRDVEILTPHAIRVRISLARHHLNKAFNARGGSMTRRRAGDRAGGAEVNYYCYGEGNSDGTWCEACPPSGHVQ